MTSKEKTKFRSSRVWKQFVAQEIKRRGLRCELTGVRLTAGTAQLHHRFPSRYDDLTPENFWLLSPTAHAMVEYLALILHGNTTKVPRREALLNWIGPFLPEPEHSARDLMEKLREEYGSPSKDSAKTVNKYVDRSDE